MPLPFPTGLSDIHILYEQNSEVSNIFLSTQTDQLQQWIDASYGADANKVLCGDMTWKDAPNITDEHINTLIDRKLGVIENGTY